MFLTATVRSFFALGCIVIAGLMANSGELLSAVLVFLAMVVGVNFLPWKE